MPQMMPLWWEILMMFFLITMFSFCVTIYHNKEIKIKKTLNMKNYIQHIWKW
uniref:ATP synthase F0 subunit 8 n=1 Tax=Urolabida menghaiensis TaxID=1603604 RepID=A0A2P1CLV3_9HEMI|nr:ATP synthase F0 subunit 8 [Urolabida menghaiensis]